MRCSFVSLAALVLAATALAAPVKKREDGVLVVVETVTITTIVYEPTGIPPSPPPAPTTTTTPPPPPPKSTPPPPPKPAPPPVTSTYIPPPPPPPPTPTPEPPKPAPEPEKPAPPPPPPQTGLDEFAQSALDTHNRHRSKHGVPPLKWNTEMANFATGHTSSCIFEHSSGSGFGENLAAGHESIKAAIDAWYEEIEDYNFSAGQFTSGTGHFTQVVWKSASEVGCGFSSCDGQNGTPGTYYSCNYDEGNLIGSFIDNVLPPIN